MIQPSDLIHLPYTPDLSEGGILSALRGMPHLEPPQLSFSSLRLTAARTAVELALRRLLHASEVPFEVEAAPLFGAPDRFEVRLGGHSVSLSAHLITRRETIRLIRREPERLLQAPALLPLDQVSGERFHDQDILLFAFLLGLTAASRADLERVRRAGQPACLVHPLMQPWSRPHVWAPLGRLTLKSEGDAPLAVELYGQDEGRNFVQLPLELPPRQRVQADGHLYALSALRLPALPEGRIGLCSERIPRPYVISPRTWGNLWIYGLEILLAGWLTREEFRRKAALLPAGRLLFPYGRLLQRHLGVPLRELRPIQPLLEKVREWKSPVRSEARYDQGGCASSI